MFTEMLIPAPKLIRLLGLAALVLSAVEATAASSVPKIPSANPIRTFHYTMTGRVRLLLFWVGRDNVGRGRISIQSAPTAIPGIQEEKITVLFGTLPERVPWGINRWGYGEEVGRWETTNHPLDKRLTFSQFTGFIRHSPEESISQLSSAQQQAKSRQSYWYDGIISSVTPEEAKTEVYAFPLDEEVSFGKMDQVRQAFELRRQAAPADKSRKLVNQPSPYGAPQGFLIGLTRLMAEIGREFKNSAGKGTWEKRRFHSSYAYNAKPYHLEVLEVKHHREFTLELPAATPSQLPGGNHFRDVAEVEIQILNPASRERHVFACWFPMAGPLENIPIQIRDNPRWWLQVRLQLTALEESGGLRKEKTPQ